LLSTIVERIALDPHVANLVPLVLEGHLSEAALAAGLEPITRRLRGTADAIDLLVDCQRMTGYDAGARSHFVRWNQQHRARVGRVAIVTDNRLWRMVIAAMSLASSREMRAFATPELARAWFSS